MGLKEKLWGRHSNPQNHYGPDEHYDKKSREERREIAQRLRLLQLRLDVMRREID